MMKMQEQERGPAEGDWMRGMSFSGAPIAGQVVTIGHTEPSCVEIDGRSSAGRPRRRWYGLTMIERIEHADATPTLAASIAALETFDRVPPVSVARPSRRSCTPTGTRTGPRTGRSRATRSIH